MSRAAWFLLSPFGKSDFQALGHQWAIMGRSLAQAYHCLGLIPDDYPSSVCTIRGALRAACDGWARKYRRQLLAGWASESDFFARVGGLAEAVLEARTTIVRDTAALAIGWAMVGALVFGLLYLVLTGAISTAHAAAASTGATGDLAKAMLKALFPFLGGASSLAQGLGRIASSLCHIAALCGGIVAVWTSGVLMVEWVDHPDTFKQRYSVPFFLGRLVVAMGLLIPLSGWSGGQMIAGAAAAWGSDRASAAWEAMVGYLSSQSGDLVAIPTVSEADLLSTIANLVAVEACKAGINGDSGVIGAKVSVSELVRDDSLAAIGMPSGWTTNGGAGGWSYDYTSALFDGASDALVIGGCGKIVLPSVGAAGSAGARVAQAQAQAFSEIHQIVATYTEELAAARIACRDGAARCQDPDASALASLPATYRAKLNQNIRNALSSANSEAQSRIKAISTQQGWVGAGQYAMQLANLLGSIEAAGTALPQITPPQPSIDAGREVIEAALQNAGQALNDAGNPLFRSFDSLGSGQEGGFDSLFSSIATPLWSVLAQVDSMNPLAGMATVGRATYRTGIGLLIGCNIFSDPPSGGVEAASPAARMKAGRINRASSALTNRLKSVGGALSNGLSNMFSAIQPVVNMIAWPLIIVGLAMAYYVPLLPFVRFYFAVVSWLLAVVEAILLLPIALLMMINAERAAGAFGPAAKAGLWSVAAMVARPILTLAGFVAGLMVLSEAVGLLNAVMLPMLRGTQTGGLMGILMADGVFAFVTYIVTYLGLVYVTANAATKAAELLPGAAYRWFGANASGERDDGSAVGAAIGGTVAKLDRAMHGLGRSAARK